MNNRLIHRDLFDNVIEWIDEREIIFILGARRVGKTTLLRMLYKELKGWSQKLFIDLEFSENLSALNKGLNSFLNFIELQGIDLRKESLIFIDEIQYLKNPSNLLKLLYDHHPNIKLIVSGSSSMYIKRKFTDSLAGRKILFELSTFNIDEFLRARNQNLYKMRKKWGYLTDIIAKKKINPGVSSFAERFAPYIEEYIIWGGYPQVLLHKQVNKKEEILRDIYQSYIAKDIKDIGSIENITGYNDLLIMLASNTGQLVNKGGISRDIGISLKTVDDYLFLLQNTYIVRMLPPFFKNKQTEIVKQQKVFFRDTGIRNISLASFQLLNKRPDKGAIVENFVLNQLLQYFPSNNIFFWRTKHKAEVDFVVKFNDVLIPIEVKAGIMEKPKYSRSFLGFIDKYKPKLALILNWNFAKVVKKKDCIVVFVPLFAI